MLLSLRDLRGAAGAALCDEMRDVLRACAKDVYGVPASKLRIFFFYQPQFYRLHAHCARIDFNSRGCDVDRAHLLSDVAQNLRLDPDYYAKATITYKVSKEEKLYEHLEGADGLM